MATQSSFPPLQSTLDLNNPQYRANRETWKTVLDKFEEALEQVCAEGNDASLARHQKRGQLLPRDRISLLLDQDSPFLEIGAFAGYRNPDSTPCANLIAGIGNVSGQPCMLMSHIPTQSGGAWNEMTVLKTNRIMEIAFQNDLPLISLVQSAGVFLPQQFRVFHKGGQLFRDLAVRTQHGKPSCAIVFGSSTAGGAYHPALSDYTIFVENQGQAFLAGPPLVKMATGEVIEAEALGGARVHATTTGLADQIASDELDAIRKAREWVATLHTPSPKTLVDTIEPRPPRYPVDDLLSLVNPDIRKPFDMREVLLRLIDDSRLSEFKPEYGRNLITGWAHFYGIQVGIIANQISVINPTEAAKGAQFIRMCNQLDTPLLFLHNVTGFMVGAKAEHAGIIRTGAQLVAAVSTSTVPHISIILGASYGAGNYAMCGRAYGPRFLFTWPSGRCSVMGPDQLSGVMESVQRSSAAAKGKVLEPEELRARVERFRVGVQTDADCYATSGSLVDDGVIDPRDTRDVVGMCLEVVVSGAGIKGAGGHRLLARI
ncbi:ClpP/crotonase [Aspergillus eucalypticola CBS 122712]|uniref:methylcrotonoyl-CoA carboxylase n=1 Tax=Aspergillus eucalypticola (strain CBS 122712 / IBT 29274) TaxID=1448314 RepID=A0A317V167_ASPEC|nr:ClpP/crotonase [Aspergillus eucalypticola CBS 122712]PWY65930.1 ClpP/crotonase [Aspergillus eucalypticola CBS 122712]